MTKIYQFTRNITNLPAISPTKNELNFLKIPLDMANNSKKSTFAE